MADGAQGKSEILKVESRNCGSDPTSPRLPPRQGVESRKARKKKQKSESVNSCPSFLGCSKPAPIPKRYRGCAGPPPSKVPLGVVAAGSGGMHPKANGRRRTVGGIGRTVCAFCRWNVSRRRRRGICRSWNGNDNPPPDTSRRRNGNRDYPPGNDDYPPDTFRYPQVNHDYPADTFRYPQVNHDYPADTFRYLNGNRRYPPGNDDYPAQIHRRKGH
jgi:hypothetical protein